MIVARGGTDNFRIIKFHKEYEYNLLRLNSDHKEYNSSFIADQIKNQVMINIDYTSKMIIIDIERL